MKRNKILCLISVILLVTFVASIALGSVAADDTVEVTVAKEKFKIPSSFKENKSMETKGGTVIKRYVDGDKFISLTVHSNEDGEISKITSQDDGSVEKEIAGKKGIYKEGSHKFTYVSDDKKSSIVAWCDSDQTLEEFLKLN